MDEITGDTILPDGLYRSAPSATEKYNRYRSHLSIGITLIGVKFIQVSLALVSSIILARAMGTTNFGTYSFILSLSLILTIPIKTGIGTLVVRETSTAMQCKDMQTFTTLWHWAIRRSLALSMIAILPMVAIAIKAQDMRAAPLLLGLVILPFHSLNACRSSALRGIGRVALSQIPEDLIRPLVLSIGVIAMWQLLDAQVLTPEAGLAAYLLSSLILFVIGSAVVRAHLVRGLREEHAQPLKDRWSNSTIPLGILGAMKMITNYTDIVLLGFFCDASQVGIYRVCSQGAAIAAVGMHASNAIMGPRFAQAFQRRDKDALLRLSRQASWMGMAISIPAAILASLAGREILGLAYGIDYVQGWSTLVILMFGQTFSATMGPIGILLSMTNNERGAAVLVGLGGALNIALNLWLIPAYGAEGAAIATCLSLLCWNTLLRTYVLKRLGI
jgi:O-antigen/teichoic acid export membrane protein